jgi:hypothetical protein
VASPVLARERLTTMLPLALRLPHGERHGDGSTLPVRAHQLIEVLPGQRPTTIPAPKRGPGRRHDSLFHEGAAASRAATETGLGVHDGPVRTGRAIDVGMRLQVESARLDRIKEGAALFGGNRQDG